MKTDRELLELAAKAAGYQISYTEDAIWWDGVAGYIPWNPLVDDGDAIRLAVALCLPIEITSVETTVRTLNIVERHGINPSAATRRAIVRAAAAIGESL